MGFAATQKALTFLMAAVAAVPVLLSGEVSVAAAAGFGALALAGWFLEPPLTRSPIYRRAVTAAIVALLAIQAARVAAGTPIARAGMEYAALVLGLKLACRGTAGDYQQIAILSFLHVIAATIVTYEISYAAGFLAFAVLSPPVLALSHLRNEMERRFRHDDDFEGRRMLEKLLRSRRVVSGGFVAGTGLLSLPVLVVTAILFVSFPRFGFGFLGRLRSPVSLAGFADEVQIGDLEGNRLEERVIIRLEPFGGSGDRPERLSLKLRGAAFDRYEGDSWKRSREKSWARIPGKGNDHALHTGFVDERTPGFEVLLESLEPSYLFVPEGTGLVTTYPVAKRGAMRPRRLEMDPNGVIRYDDDSKVGIRYRVFLTGAPPPEGLGTEDPRPGESGPDYLALPPGSERLAAAARRAAGGGDARARARALARHLESSYRYSDAPGPGGPGAGGSPLERFLFSRRTGTCEHFATALTLMLRAVGVPSRMVTGFGSAEWNSIGEFYAVRLRSAHAWTEARAGGRWIVLDATPAREGPALSSRPSALAMALDALRMRWHKWVVGYDASSQMDLARRLEALLRDRTPSAPLGLPSGIWWIAIAAIAAVAAYLVWRRRAAVRALLGRRRASRPEGRAALVATALYRALERRLGSLGWPRSAHQTPAEHVREVRRADPDLGERSTRIVDRYNDARFGGRDLPAREAALLRAEIRSLEPGPRIG